MRPQNQGESAFTFSLSPPFPILAPPRYSRSLARHSRESGNPQIGELPSRPKSSANCERQIPSPFSTRSVIPAKAGMTGQGAGMAG